MDYETVILNSTLCIISTKIVKGNGLACLMPADGTCYQTTPSSQPHIIKSLATNFLCFSDDSIVLIAIHNIFIATFKN